MKQERPLVVYLVLFIVIYFAVYFFIFLLITANNMQDVGIEQCIGNGYPEEYCRSLLF